MPDFRRVLLTPGSVRAELSTISYRPRPSRLQHRSVGAKSILRFVARKDNNSSADSDQNLRGAQPILRTNWSGVEFEFCFAEEALMVAKIGVRRMPMRLLRTPIMVPAVVACCTVVAQGPVGLADTAPSGPPPSAPSQSAGGHCEFSLSAPRAGQLGSAPHVVSATIKPVSCVGGVVPAETSVCIAPHQGAGTCSTGYGWNTAQAFFGVAQGTPVEVTGQGCWTSIQPDQPGCTAVGPVSGTV